MTCIDEQQNTMKRFLGYRFPAKIGAQKLPIFDDFATQWHIWGPISPVRNRI